VLHIHGYTRRVRFGGNSYEIKKLSALLIIAATPLALFASSETDGKIEDAAKASYNYRTVLEDHVKVKANVSAADTKVAVENGNVTLTGTADNIAQKDLTALYAKEIDNVKSVKNDIVVKAVPPSGETIGEKIDDASITSQLKYSLLSHKATSAIKTKVTTTDGVVVITGEAASEAEKSLVTKLAEDVRGVKSVSNNMTVKS